LVFRKRQKKHFTQVREDKNQIEDTIRKLRIEAAYQIKIAETQTVGVKFRELKKTEEDIRSIFSNLGRLI
jgi:hypothetical protein